MNCEAENSQTNSTILVFRVAPLKVELGEIRSVQGFFLITITTKMWGQLQRELVWFGFFYLNVGSNKAINLEESFHTFQSTV